MHVCGIYPGYVYDSDGQHFPSLTEHSPLFLSICLTTPWKDFWNRWNFLHNTTQNEPSFLKKRKIESSRNMHWHHATTLKFSWKKKIKMLTAFHTTKRNPKSKALNAVLESVWVMPPSILHHSEVPQKGDKAENHSSAFRAAPCAVSAGGAILCPQPWGWDREGTSLSLLPLQLLSHPQHCPFSLLSSVSPPGCSPTPISGQNFAELWCPHCCSGICTKK